MRKPKGSLFQGGVALANGTQIDYLVDGTHRRIGKKVNGGLSRAFLYQNTQPPESATQLFRASFVAQDSAFPTRSVRAGKTSRLICDERGSPRLESIRQAAP